MDSVENLESFANALLDGNLKPYLKSEPVPASNDEPVKVLRTHAQSHYPDLVS